MVRDQRIAQKYTSIARYVSNNKTSNQNMINSRCTYKEIARMMLGFEANDMVG
jgi:hypothetical protein